MRAIRVSNILCESGRKKPLSFSYIFDDEEERTLDFDDPDFMVEYVTDLAEFQWNCKILNLEVDYFFDVEDNQSNRIYRFIQVKISR
jgi:hypothetical protein